MLIKTHLIKHIRLGLNSILFILFDIAHPHCKSVFIKNTPSVYFNKESNLKNDENMWYNVIFFSKLLFLEKVFDKMIELMYVCERVCIFKKNKNIWSVILKPVTCNPDLRLELADKGLTLSLVP